MKEWFMLRSRRWVLVAAMLAGLLTVPSAAVAEHEESHQGDTVFSFGYDDVNHVLAVDHGADDTPSGCDLGTGPLAVVYLTPDNGVIPVQYAGAVDPCVVTGVVVAGPNGQINHGQFMKAAKSLIDIQGQGCVVRYLAKSDIGRTDDTKLGPSDSTFEVGGIGEIDFWTIDDADCSHGNKNKNVEATSQGNKGRTDPPGNSGDAPGKKK
jgi:hypothetical protein